MTSHNPKKSIVPGQVANTNSLFLEHVLFSLDDEVQVVQVGRKFWNDVTGNQRSFQPMRARLTSFFQDWSRLVNWELMTKVSPLLGPLKKNITRYQLQQLCSSNLRNASFRLLI
jgi:hypothetical protein